MGSFSCERREQSERAPPRDEKREGRTAHDRQGATDHYSPRPVPGLRRGPDRDDVAGGVARIGLGLREEFSRRSPGQRRMLIELGVYGTDAPASTAFVEAEGMANPSPARKAVRLLEADELVVERNGRWKVADPFFAAWLADTSD